LSSGQTRILVVDDSALYRQSIQNILRDVAEVSIVGVAKNGIEALSKIEELDPDLLTLDVQMPELSGIEVLREIKRRRLRPKAIMVSTFTSEGARVTTDALLEGAFDFILKPSGNDSAANRGQLRDALVEKIAAFREAALPPPRSMRGHRLVDANEGLAPSPAPGAACQAVILGSSTGGPEALKLVLPKLPKTLPVPVLVVQHMPPKYTLSLAARLNENCALDVAEARDHSSVVPGRVLIAPGGKHLRLERSGDSLLVRLSDDPPEHGVRPSIDYLLRSVAEVLNGQALAVVMTGMGRDGLAGCRCLKEAGGYVFAQTRADCVVYGMPKAVIEDNLADRTLPLGKIAPAIVRHLNRCRRA
jgi:two-component system chemotaxis response regulator CheB